MILIKASEACKWLTIFFIYLGGASFHQHLYNNSRWISSLSPFKSLHNLFCYLSPSLCSSLHPLFHASFCPALFIISLSLCFSFLCVATSWLSHALQAWCYPNQRGNYWENISGYQHLSGYAPSQFLQLDLWSHEWKMTILKALTDLKPVGENYSQAIKYLV